MKRPDGLTLLLAILAIVQALNLGFSIAKVMRLEARVAALEECSQ